jgi:K+-sensing histidine kinase KdpD
LSGFPEIKDEPSSPLSGLMTQHGDTAVRTRDAVITALIHDLRSPLGAIEIFCEIQASGKETSEDSKTRSLSMIRMATAKAQLALEDAAEVISIVKGSFRSGKLESIEVRSLLEAVIVEMKEICLRKKVNILPLSGTSNVVLTCDVPRVKDMLTCMLQEAVVASPKDGEISLVTGQTPSGISITVRSHSPPDDQRALLRPLDPFGMRGRLGERKPGISRYCLTVCAKLAEIMGGSFSWVSEPSFNAILHLPFAQR